MSGQSCCHFPVFVGAVLAAGLLYRKEGYTYRLLVIEGVLLLAAGVLSAGVLSAGVLPAGVLAASAGGLPFSVAKMLVVAAMGIQNAFGQLYSKAAYGTTTTMTGNVTGAVLAFVPGWLRVPGDAKPGRAMDAESGTSELVSPKIRFGQIVIMILALPAGLYRGRRPFPSLGSDGGGVTGGNGDSVFFPPQGQKKCPNLSSQSAANGGAAITLWRRKRYRCTILRVLRPGRSIRAIL